MAIETASVAMQPVMAFALVGGIRRRFVVDSMAFVDACHRADVGGGNYHWACAGYI